MNDLEKFFFEKDHKLIHKWKHYFEVYDRHFSRFRNRKINILEIGISHGGSLEMWNDYFHGNATIYAVDINPECKKFENDYTRVLIGSQEDKKFLQKLNMELPSLDILIDDGGHSMKQQIMTFEQLYDKVKEDGVYLIEDLHTSFLKFYGGGYKKSRTFIEYSKNFIDKLHAWHTKKIPVDNFVKSTHSLHFYDSILVLEKRKMSAPSDIKSGLPAIVDENVSLLLVNLSGTI
jgi:Methyltransferase domain